MQLRRDGQSLIEVIIVLALFLLISVGVIGALSSSLGASKRGSDTIAATGYVKEAVEAVRSIRDRDWAEVTAGTYGLDTGAGYYELQGSGDTFGPNNNFTRTITIEDVNRSPGLQGDISSSGVNDPKTKKVTVDVLWDLFAGQPRTITEAFYVYNYSGAGQSWVQTIQADFDAGFKNSTDTKNDGGGEVVLRESDSNWSGLTTQHVLDLDGNGDRVAAQYVDTQDKLYVLATNTAGDEFLEVDVSDVSVSTPTVLDGYDMGGVTPNDFVVQDGYAYIASSSNTAEVQVIDLENMTQVNTIDLIGTVDALTVDVFDSTLVVGRANDTNDEVYTYDITNPTGNIPQNGTAEIGADVNDVVVDSDYAYLATSDGAEVRVIRLSDVTEVNTVDLQANNDAESLYLDGSDLYVGRAFGGPYQFARLGVSTPEGTISVEDDISLSGSVNDIDVTVGSGFAALAVDDGGGELVVLDLGNFTDTEIGDTNNAVSGLSVDVFGGHIYLGTDDADEDVSVFYTGGLSWNPTLIGSADKAGNHDANDVYIDGNYAYLITDAAGGSDELFIYDISTPSSPSLSGSFDVGAQVNDIHVSGNYAYLATADNSRELDVIDISDKTAPIRAGSYNTPGSTDGLTVVVAGANVYIGSDRVTGGGPPGGGPPGGGPPGGGPPGGGPPGGGPPGGGPPGGGPPGGGPPGGVVYAIDVATPSSPALLDDLELSQAEISDLLVNGTVLYATNRNSPPSDELFVIDISSPNALSEITSLDLSGDGGALSLGQSGDVLVVGKESGNGDELVTLDMSTPSSPSVISGADIDVTVYGVAAGGGYAYIVTDDTGNEFQRWNISSNPLGQTDTFDLGANGFGVRFDGTYAYVATANDNLELQIIGEGIAGIDYAPVGTFTSQPFDSGGAGTAWNGIEWTTSGAGSIEFRIRTADTEVNLENAVWVGSDGTRNTTYDTVGQSIATNPNATGTRWVQWKVYVSGTPSTTPVIEDVTITY